MAATKKPTTPKKTESKKPEAKTDTPKAVTLKTGADAVRPDIVNAAVTAGKETVEAVTAASKETVETVVQAGTKAAQKTYDEAVSKGCEQFETVAQVNIDAIRGLEEVIAVNEAGFEAMIRANTIFAKGIEEIAAEWLGYAKTTTEAQAAAVRAMMVAKSPAAFVAAQTDFAKASFISSVNESRKLRDMSSNLLDETVKPVAEQAWSAAETLSTARAA